VIDRAAARPAVSHRAHPFGARPRNGLKSSELGNGRSRVVTTAQHRLLEAASWFNQYWANHSSPPTSRIPWR